MRSGKSAVHAALDSFPFIVDTPGQRKRHNELMRQLAELDAADKAFSRNKVVVADDDAAMVPADVPDVEMADDWVMVPAEE